MNRSLALDLARVAGAAWRDGDGHLVTRAATLGSATTKRAAKLGALFSVVNGLLDEVRPDLVSVEDDTGRGAGSRTLRAYHAVAELACALRGIPCRVDIGASKARALALGDGGLSKDGAAQAARIFFGIVGTPDEVDAAILLIATERAIEMEAYAAAGSRASRTAKRRAA